MIYWVSTRVLIITTNDILSVYKCVKVLYIYDVPMKGGGDKEFKTFLDDGGRGIRNSDVPKLNKRG